MDHEIECVFTWQRSQRRSLPILFVNSNMALNSMFTPVLAKTGKDTGSTALLFVCQSFRWSLLETIAEASASDSPRAIPEMMIALSPDTRSR